jgi:hypothetical protein
VSGFLLIDPSPHEYVEVSSGEQWRLRIAIASDIRVEHKGDRCRASLLLRGVSDVDSDEFQM